MKDKQKKILIIGGIVICVLIVITAVLLLISNNRKNSGNTTTTGNTVTDVGTGDLVYWGLWEPDSVMQPIIEEYEALHPGINILYSQQSFSNYESKLYTRLQQASTSSEPAPDIFRIHNTWTPKYYRYLYPLPTNIMTAEEYASTFYPTATADFKHINGYIYAIPFEIDGLVVFYNKQLLSEQGYDEPPQDWDTFVEAAGKLTERTESGKITTAGVAMGTAKNINHSAEILSFLLLAEGIDIIDSTKTQVNLNNTKAAAVLETYTSFASGDSATWSADLRTDLEMFYSGDLAMMIAPSWRTFDIIEAAPTIEFDTAPLPQLKANEEEIYYSTYWGEAVSSTCSNPTAAWDFINFLASKETQMKLYSNSSQVRAFGEPYSLVELNSEMLNKTYVSAVAEMASNMQSWSMGDESFVKAELNSAITGVIENGQESSFTLSEAENNINEQLAETNQ
jgi:multiple sugar transport system substrate-binding protein